MEQRQTAFYADTHSATMCAFPTFYVSSMFSHLSRRHFMELDLGNVENEKVMRTNFFSLSESVAIYCKVYNKNIFITSLCFKVGSYYTTQADLYSPGWF